MFSMIIDNEVCISKYSICNTLIDQHQMWRCTGTFPDQFIPCSVILLKKYNIDKEDISNLDPSAADLSRRRGR